MPKTFTQQGLNSQRDKRFHTSTETNTAPETFQLKRPAPETNIILRPCSHGDQASPETESLVRPKAQGTKTQQRPTTPEHHPTTPHYSITTSRKHKPISSQNTAHNTSPQDSTYPLTKQQPQMPHKCNSDNPQSTSTCWNGFTTGGEESERQKVHRMGVEQSAKTCHTTGAEQSERQEVSHRCGDQYSTRDKD